MVLCHSEVVGYVVIYQYRGMTSKMITMDKIKADAYAVQHYGIIKSMHCPIDVQPSKKEQFSKEDPPWEGETQVEQL